jgi:tetratricopeptide (TPR) repeat protein
MNDEIRFTQATRRTASCAMRQAACGVFALLSLDLHADTLVLKNGQTVTGKSFLREGDAIFVTAGPNGEPVTAETGTPLTEIAKVECDPPVVFKKAPAMLAAGKASKVLADVVAALKVAETFGDLPGSRWPDLLVLQAYILVGMGKDDEAVKMATAMKKTKNAELVRDSQALLALIAARKGDHGEAASLLEDLTNEAASPCTIAAAAVIRGLGLLAKKQFPEALKAFLELPVFLPNETALGGIAQLGAAQAYYGMEDYDRAIAALESLIKTQPGIPEIDKAQTLLPEWQRRRRAVLEAKEP